MRTEIIDLGNLGRAVPPIELLLFSADADVIRQCCAPGPPGLGVDGVIVDWENRGKRERQAGYDTQINVQTEADLRRARMATPAGRPVICRINAWADGVGPAEVEVALANGATEILLPMVRSPREVEQALCSVKSRAELGILIETRQAVECARELDRFNLRRIYVGLNDLAIDRGSPSIFDALIDGTVDRVRDAVRHTPFGIAGLTLAGCGSPIPTLMLAGELARLQADFTFLRRSFLADIRGRDPRAELPRMREMVAMLARRAQAEVEAGHVQFRRAASSLQGIGAAGRSSWRLSAAV